MRYSSTDPLTLVYVRRRLAAAAPKPPLVGYGGWTYFLTSGAMTWQEARAEVEIVPGASLATFDSEVRVDWPNSIGKLIEEAEPY